MAAQAKLTNLVQRCLLDVAKHPVEHVDVYLEDDDVFKWHLALHFTDSAPFMGGPDLCLRASNFSLYLTMIFDEGFPARPPKLKFLSPWINHQHLWGDRICHSLLTDDFLQYFQERRTHGTSMWSAACALADGSGMGGMPRYLQVLREYLASDLDYAEEDHVKYDAESLLEDVERQRRFRPDFWSRLECLMPCETLSDTAKDFDKSTNDTQCGNASEESCGTISWGIDFFSKSPLIPGDPEFHPCFDVTITPGRVPGLSTSMKSLCKRSFQEGARTNDFGNPIVTILPHPCSYQAWTAVGSALTLQTLQDLIPVSDNYKLLLPGFDSDDAGKLEAVLAVIGEIWKTTCIGIVKDDNFASERAMSCFATLHHLMLRLEEVYPGLRCHAVATAIRFLELIDNDSSANLKAFVPDLGRFLVRFLLTESEAPLRRSVPILVKELFSRNVRWVHPDDWPEPDASEIEREAQIAANFEKSQFGMKMTVFQLYYIIRSSELGLHSLAAHEALGDRPSAEVLRVFQRDCHEIKAMTSFQEFFSWLQLEDQAAANIHAMLLTAVKDSEKRGYNEGLPWRRPS